MTKRRDDYAESRTKCSRTMVTEDETCRKFFGTTTARHSHLQPVCIISRNISHVESVSPSRVYPVIKLSSFLRAKPHARIIIGQACDCTCGIRCLLIRSIGARRTQKTSSHGRSWAAISHAAHRTLKCHGAISPCLTYVLVLPRLRIVS